MQKSNRFLNKTCAWNAGMEPPAEPRQNPDGIQARNQLDISAIAQ
jgi:hypothetical protein